MVRVRCARHNMERPGIAKILKKNKSSCLPLWQSLVEFADIFTDCDNANIHHVVKNLCAHTPFPQNTSLKQRIEMLRHIGLTGLDGTNQLTHVFLTIAQAVENFESRWRRQHMKQARR